MRNRLETFAGLSAALRRLRTRSWLLGLGLTAGILAVGCSQGSYPLDIFYEMHYQQSHKSQEPPRLTGVEGAVAVFDGPVSTSFGVDGQHLFEVNCAMCHGPGAKGDGPVLQKLISDYGYVPAVTPDLTSEQVKAMGEGGVMGFMSSGLNVMPNFSKLLTHEEQTAIAKYVSSLP
ncbi:MAG: hypothetical protein BZY88_13860 [SAR202 cluster bacterium Io17-Chloro-G9]|nr:MAG: hypothetical protein BZY88_13860 [SAR202 cluster bacterium Io17-Chloro-G9]